MAGAGRRFPTVSGLRVEWDSRRPPGSRVLSIQLELSGVHSSNASDSSLNLTTWRDLKRQKGGEKYRVVTRDYLAQGHDGFESFKDYPLLIDDETGLMMSTLVRRYLLGSQYIHTLQQMEDIPPTIEPYLSRRTDTIIRTARERWKHAAAKVLHAHRRHIKDALHVANHEHMSRVDCYDGQAARSGTTPNCQADNNLITIHPVVDGRLRDRARQDERGD